MPTETRRGFLGWMGAALVVAASPAQALDTNEARALIQTSLDQVYRVINSGAPSAQMYRDFEAIFARYADVDVIARSALGPAARQASPQQFAAYKAAFQGYIGRKYGKRFREFIGSKIEVKEAHKVKSFYAVTSIAFLKGRAPLEVEWHVSDKSGQSRFFNIIIEGINMLASERTEIGAMLARRHGDLAGLTADLQQAG
ncbi:ABC transporter substrate-binding protein [Paracoccus sp. (in: a-proteobacteria)]|uniref:MlaC/ttg2D family ABC transporter substrate-binding protein n=1 Tax=Paracoccus sp. TaxID=267 RepID=UPI002899C438|nr:ABC transporter substrate-binding protein [Paracoccus sp. (in: a-proteobacteria)]